MRLTHKQESEFNWVLEENTWSAFVSDLAGFVASDLLEFKKCMFRKVHSPDGDIHNYWKYTKVTNPAVQLIIFNT